MRLFWLRLGGVEVHPVDEAIGLAAGRLYAAYYQRERRPLSPADCVVLATALAAGDRLATSDPALITTAKAENCLVHPLPDSTGRRVSA